MIVVGQLGSIIDHIYVNEEQALTKGSHELKTYIYDPKNERAYLLEGALRITV